MAPSSMVYLSWVALICTSEQGKVSTFQVSHILEARVDKVRSGELGPNARPATHDEAVTLGIERGYLLHKVGIFLLPVWGNIDVVGDISSTGDMALVKVLPHPDVQILVRSRAEEGACLIRIHHRNHHRILLVAAAAAAAASERTHCNCFLAR
uniref:Uncharacterized protein n=1 Tax=Arundo donax TaxID=35708 RepID=A0A0A9FSL5_ARUDO